MRVLVDAFVRQRLRSPVRVLLALVVFAFSTLPALLARDLGVLDASAATLFALIVAAGAIGQDVSSGVITLTLARPVVRWRYVIARWLGASLLSAALAALLVLAATLAVIARGSLPQTLVVLRLVLELVLAAAGMAAVVIGFSSVVNGLADVGLIAAGAILAGIVQLIGGANRLPWLSRLGAEVSGSLAPTLSLAPWFAGDWSAWPRLASYLSTVTLALAVAAWAVSRREYSYAAD